MIHFLCICGEPFDVPAELAGDSMQCPVCRRLVDVPMLGDIDAFTDDGTVRLADANQTPSALEDKMTAFGGRADMRPELEDFLIAGTGDPATTPRARPTPRYDPITGELMLPVEIMDDDLPPPPTIDVGAPVLGYARTVQQAGPSADPSTLSWWNLPWRLVGGMSLMAMVIIYVMHAVMYLPMLMPGFNVLWLPLTFGVTITLIAHYANTMEDFGPNDRDYVPALMRNASPTEDVLGPLLKVGTAALYSFWPLMLTSFFAPDRFYRHHEWVLYALTAWGMLLFPLAVFTTVCGGVMHNLMPQRVWSVVKAAPAKLVMAVLTFWLAMAAYGVATSAMDFGKVNQLTANTPTQGEMLRFLIRLGITFTSFAGAVYLMHLAAGWMGLMYRAHHWDYDWVLQRHERAYGSDMMAELMERRALRRQAAGDPQRMKALRDADAARAGARKPGLPSPRRHEGFEVKIKTDLV